MIRTLIPFLRSASKRSERLGCVKMKMQISTFLVADERYRKNFKKDEFGSLGRPWSLLQAFLVQIDSQSWLLSMLDKINGQGWLRSGKKSTSLTDLYSNLLSSLLLFHLFSRYSVKPAVEAAVHLRDILLGFFQWNTDSFDTDLEITFLSQIFHKRDLRLGLLPSVDLSLANALVKLVSTFTFLVDMEFPFVVKVLLILGLGLAT